MVVYNASSPDLVVRVRYRRRWESLWTQFDDFTRLVISRVWDAGHTLQLDVMNAGGEYSEFWQPGTRLRVEIGLGRLYGYPLFEGFIPPGQGLELDAAVYAPTIRVGAVSYLGQLTREFVPMGEYADEAAVTRQPSYVGWEVGMAIRDILGGLEGGFLDTSGVLATDDPKTFIDEDRDVRGFGLYTKLQLVRHYLDLAFNDQSETFVARPYHIVEAQAERSPGVVGPIARMFKEPNAATATPYRSVNLDAEGVKIRSQSQFQQVTRCIAQSSQKSSVFAEYADTDAEAAWGQHTLLVKVATTDRAALLRRAYGEVQARRAPQLAYQVDLLDAWWAYPGMVIDFTNTRFGSRGQQLVTRVDHEVSQDAVRTSLYTRARPEEVVP